MRLTPNRGLARWSWAALMVAAALAAALLLATTGRYRTLADWTREARVVVREASVTASPDEGAGAAAGMDAATARAGGATIRLALEFEAPRLGFEVEVDRVEFSLGRGGRHLGYLYTTPGEVTVEGLDGTRDRRRIEVTKLLDAALGLDLLGTDGDGPIELAGSVVVNVALARGKRPVHIQISGEVVERENG